ncbi:MAG: NADH-quinone oxidoreductase subunit NuoD, partial [Chloroflexi bacterium HGW-Chloroflexi-7]
MSEQTAIHPLYAQLISKFPDSVVRDDRAGFNGVVVQPLNLLEVVKELRDSLGYDYLSSVTAADDFPEERLEVIYHLFKSVGGAPAVIKVFLGREEPVVPSLTPMYPGAELQEREV